MGAESTSPIYKPATPLDRLRWLYVERIAKANEDIAAMKAKVAMIEQFQEESKFLNTDSAVWEPCDSGDVGAPCDKAT